MFNNDSTATPVFTSPPGFRMETETDGTPFIWWGPEFRSDDLDFVGDLSWSPRDGLLTSIRSRGRRSSIDSITPAQLHDLAAVINQLVAAVDAVPVELHEAREARA